MTTSPPSLLRLRVLSFRPHLTLTEIQLVDGALLYRRLDARDHVPSEARAVRPSAADWAKLRRLLDRAAFWLWPRRWPRVHDGYAGEFVIGVDWDGRAVMSAGPIGVAPEVDLVLEEVGHVVGDARHRSSEPVPTLLSPGLPPSYQPEALGSAIRMQSRVTHAG